VDNGVGKGRALKVAQAFLTLTFGEFCDQKDGVEANGHGLQFSPTSAFADHFSAHSRDRQTIPSWGRGQIGYIPSHRKFGHTDSLLALQGNDKANSGSFFTFSIPQS